jgi:uncharacterized membrane protein
MVQNLLRGGLYLSLILMLAGVALKWAHQDFSSVGIGLRDIFGGGLSWDDFLMTLGVLTLAITPVLRVVTLLTLWILESDWVFVGVAFGVLVVLSVSISLGGG